MTELPMTEHAENFASTLRRARERSGRSLRDIADVTKLSIRNLSALEHNRITQLPGGIYRRAIVRAYAAHVGLDPEKTLRAFLTHYPDDVPTWAELVPAQTAVTVRGTMHALINMVSTLTR
jgi:cytoskeletal protein RodZ